jgi:outer membrane protein OmpA-like peptidoglycan-associated protein
MMRDRVRVSQSVSRLWVLSLVGVAGVTFGGCSVGTKLRNAASVLQSDLKPLKEEAERCQALKSYALASAEVDFVFGEIRQGDQPRANDHLAKAKKHVKDVQDQLKKCPPKVIPVVVLADRDKDGVPDVQDRCPDVPGAKENQGCPVDTDGDGIPDNLDRCPNDPGPAENDGCPWGDRDKDGVKDNEDKCPDVPGVKENKGCPWPDTDGDGVTDNLDKCVNEPGPKENDGCPWPDRDKDGIFDKDDKCPDVPGVKELAGCPRPVYKLITVEKKRIKLSQKIFFAYNKAKIDKKSFAMLEEVAQAFRDFPAIKCRIEGHTDNRGNKRHNKKLSGMRADAVRNFLIAKGVAADRLAAVGYGPERPLESNKTGKGREANRRVEFNILDDEKPANQGGSSQPALP